MKQSFERALTYLPFATLLLALSACGSDKNGADGGQGGQSGSSGGNGGVGGSSQISGLLVDDFEDGDSKPNVPGGWYGYTDVPNGGVSTLTFTGGTGANVAVAAAGYQSQKAIEVSYSFDQGTLTYAPFVGFGVSLGSAASPIDLSTYSGISYSYRGGAHRVQLQTTEVADYDYYGVTMPASTTWKTVTLPFKTFTQEDWGTQVGFDPSHVIAIDYNIRGNTGLSDKLAIDDLYVVKSTGPEQPDMTVYPASPPSDGTIDSIAIANPLQAKAMKYLDRGYNITNWLEQVRFSGFSYDESFVKKLAAAGFKGIRLPVDFDLYVTSKSGSGDSLSVVVDPESVHGARLVRRLDASARAVADHRLPSVLDAAGQGQRRLRRHHGGALGRGGQALRGEPARGPVLRAAQRAGAVVRRHRIRRRPNGAPSPSA
ncbi:MAG: CIA30 family protein [Polyangiaceae bacterium]